MKNCKSLWAILFALIMVGATLPAEAKKEKKEKPAKEVKSDLQQVNLYGFGLCTSFKDSTIYVTDIMPIENVITEKGKKPIYIGAYAKQFKTFVEQSIGEKDRMSVFFFDKKQSKVEKSLRRVKKEQPAENGYRWQTVTAEQFRFVALTPQQLVDIRNNGGDY